MHNTRLKSEILAIIERLSSLEGALLPILHAIQDEYNYIPDEAIPLLCEQLNLTRADVHGVISFYHDFRKAPPGKHVLRLCRAEACQSMGGGKLAQFIMEQFGLDWHETTKDKLLTLEPVFCLGLCANAPAIMLDRELIAECDETVLDKIRDGVGA